MFYHRAREMLKKKYKRMNENLFNLQAQHSNDRNGLFAQRLDKKTIHFSTLLTVVGINTQREPNEKKKQYKSGLTNVLQTSLASIHHGANNYNRMTL